MTPRIVVAALALWEQLDYERGTLARRKLTKAKLLLLLEEMSLRERRLYYAEVQRRLKADPDDLT